MDRYESIVCAHTRLNCKYLPLPPCVRAYLYICIYVRRTPNARTPHIFLRACAPLIFRPDVNRKTMFAVVPGACEFYTLCLPTDRKAAQQIEGKSSARARDSGLIKYANERDKFRQVLAALLIFPLRGPAIG
jgi:hypothetical protein